MSLFTHRLQEANIVLNTIADNGVMPLLLIASPKATLGSLRFASRFLRLKA
jgi:hypothetical protein